MLSWHGEQTKSLISSKAKNSQKIYILRIAKTGKLRSKIFHLVEDSIASGWFFLENL